MAKRQRSHQVTVAFHYLVKSIPSEDDSDNPIEDGFTEIEFLRVIERISNTTPIDDKDDKVISEIKSGKELPFNYYENPEKGLHFGDFEGAYYGQKYRNNRLGIIEADSLNLRPFHYIITRLRDGKILIGVTYHGLYGDYEGMRNCLSSLLSGPYTVSSKTLKSTSTEIGNGQPISLKLTYRKQSDRAEKKPLFGSSGVLAIRNTDYGDEFEERIDQIARKVKGTTEQRKKAIANLVSEDDMLELDENDIIGCSAVVRENGRQRTVYFIGDNNFSTKFPLAVEVDKDGLADRDRIFSEMKRVMRESIIPLIQ